MLRGKPVHSSRWRWGTAHSASSAKRMTRVVPRTVRLSRVQRQRQEDQVLAVATGTGIGTGTASWISSLREERVRSTPFAIGHPICDFWVPAGCPHQYCKWRRQCVVAPSRAKHAYPFDSTHTHFIGSLMSATTPPTALPRAAPGAPAEEQATAFEDDPRVYFDTQSSRWRLEDGDAELEYEPSRAVWIPVVSLPLPAPQKD